MDEVGLVAAVAIGVVFVVGGVMKLVARDQWTADASAFGVPASFAAVVPWVELAVGALCIVRLGMPGPPIAAFVLLAAFTVGIARRLIAGDHPPCACFGMWSSRPIGPATLVRNAAFAAVAFLAIWA